MVQMIRPHRSLKNLQIETGGEKTETLLAVALAVVIVGALALTIYFTFFRSSATSAAGETTHWKCSKCGYEFTVDRQTELRLQDMDKPMADCPSCGAKRSAYKMVKCYKCGKYFVPESAKDLTKPIEDDVCPYCGTNWKKGLDEYIASHK